MGDPILALDTAVFHTPRAVAAFQKYAAATNLTVRLYDRDERMIGAPAGSNVLAELFAEGREPRLFDECVKACLARTDTSAVVLENGHGLAVVGTPFTNDGEVVGAGVAGYVLTGHLDQREMQRLARDSGLSFEAVWNVVRRELPVVRQRLPLYGELLRTIGDTLLSEHSRSRQLEEALARLEAADRSKDEFLATLSHELRTPLASILGWTRILRSGKLDEAMTVRAVETIARNAHAQTRLINDLLDVSRIVVGKLHLDLEGVDLVPIIEAVLDTVRVAANAKELRLQAMLDPSVGSVSADPDRLRQIMTNLLSNAVKFTPSGGRIDVRLEQEGSEAKITVSDTGDGISPEALPYIFERFRQADSTRTRAHGGLGLGLAIVRYLLERQGGTVRAESRGVGQGATFTVTLPLLVDLPRQLTGASGGASTASVPTLDGTRVLVVDDDADTRDMLRMALEESGARVTVAASANEALTVLDGCRPDALLCDVGLPGTDGYMLLRMIRARGAERGGAVPAVALTGYVSSEDRERARSAGFQLHLAKPIDPDDLTREIARLVDRQTAASPARPEER